jgi:phage/plasmid-like protein (TIGR03299 family)
VKATRIHGLFRGKSEIDRHPLDIQWGVIIVSSTTNVTRKTAKRKPAQNSEGEMTMSHEIEVKDGKASHFYVGQTPWHSLGTKLDAPPTTKEGMIAAGLDWTVGLKPLFTGEGEQVTHRATFRETDGKILGVVGPAYNPLQNSDAFGFFDEFLDAKEATLETAGSLRGGARIWVLAKINRAPSVIVKGDEVQKYVLLSNSHDGTLATRVGFTPIRVVCNNTLSMAHNNGASKLLRVRHAKKNVQALEAVREAMNLADASFEATADVYRALAAKPFCTADLQKFVKIVFPNARQKKEIAKPDYVVGEGSAIDSILNAQGDSRTFGSSINEVLAETARDSSSRAYEAIADLFENGQGNKLPGVAGTAWAALNAVTEFTTHVRGRSPESRLNAYFNDGAAINARALDAAIQLTRAA